MSTDMQNVLIVEQLAHIQAQLAQDDQVIVIILKRRNQWEKRRKRRPSLNVEKDPIRSLSPANA